MELGDDRIKVFCGTDVPPGTGRKVSNTSSVFSCTAFTRDENSLATNRGSLVPDSCWYDGQTMAQ